MRIMTEKESGRASRPRTGYKTSPRGIEITFNTLLYPVQSCIEAAQDLTPNYWVHLDINEDENILLIRLEPRDKNKELPPENEVYEFFNYVLHVMRKSDLIKPL